METIVPRLLITLVVGLVLGLSRARADTLKFDHFHNQLNIVLTEFVREGLVDYTALKANPAKLDVYLKQLSAITREEFERWTESQQIAFLINGYNAYTLKLIIDHHPIKSIKNIGGWFSGPWDQPVVQLFGETMTLNRVEHKILRVDYNEPRLHFALVCAAKGCPPLRDEAYIAERLDAQLDDQARQFLATPAKNRVSVAERVVYLSPIFKWYGDDFVKQSGSVLVALKPYWPEKAAAALAAGDFKIRYTDYDWSLNDWSK